MPTVTIAPGATLNVDGMAWSVCELSGHRVLLRGDDGRFRQVELLDLLAVLGGLGESQTPQPLPASIVLSNLTPGQRSQLTARTGHVLEVLTGFQHGCPELAREGEPRPSYTPHAQRMDRYRAKAAELRLSVRTVQRWCQAYQTAGPLGLLCAEVHEFTESRGADPRWTDMCRQVLAARTGASRPTKALVLQEVRLRLEAEFGTGQVRIPAQSTAYRLLRELSRGTNAFTGSIVGKRNIADRAQGVYGKLRATHPGEYLLLDTTRLDVFALDPRAGRWTQVELTAAMDLYSRCITGLRLTPVSTKATDAAGVLQEAFAAGQGTNMLPYHGIPSSLVVNAAKLADSSGRRLLPSAAGQTIVIDHGKIYLSELVHSVCASLGISIQPARPGKPTDKSPVERWFGTLADSLLVALPGYKGSDVHSRGTSPEDQAYFTIDELDAIVREWIVTIYHQRPHDGLCIPEIAGLELSPQQMWEHGLNRAGAINLPDSHDLAYCFLPVAWRTIQHYGVEIGGLRYHGAGLLPYRDTTSSHTGKHAGKWPISYDPNDIRYAYFRDPVECQWHQLIWEHAPAMDGPMSTDALNYARRLAADTGRFHDTNRVLAELLARWNVGLTDNRAERTIAARLAQQALPSIANPLTPAPQVEVPEQAASVPQQRSQVIHTRSDHRASTGSTFYDDVMDSD